jgi:two-component system chemotaxis sensor kinase CheA
VLLVDDSAFFRNLLSPLLSVNGFDVTSCASADEAMTLCEAGEAFDAIVSDIEMPGMSGFEFAEAVRRSSKWAEVPMVAMTSHTGTEDVERGRQVGFTDYVAKSDRDGLIATLTETLNMRGAQ